MSRFKKIISAILSVGIVAGVAIPATSLSAGAVSTGAGLAEHALNAYYEEWSYVWGGTEVGAVDCSGLIWMYCGGNRTSMLSDAQANGRDWGYVDNGIPRVHGLGLSRPNHVGVYIEDGWEVDARGSDYGVCYQQIGENGWNNWDCWFKLTAVQYPDYGWEEFNGNFYFYEDGEYIVNTSREISGTTYYFDSSGHADRTPSDMSVDYSSTYNTNTSQQSSFLRYGSVGDEVTKMQTRLSELGYYNSTVDGIFGPLTEEAFKQFQKNAGLFVDGIAGSDKEVLYSDTAPAAILKTAVVEDDNSDDDNLYEDSDNDLEEEDVLGENNINDEDDEDLDSQMDEIPGNTTDDNTEDTVVMENYMIGEEMDDINSDSDNQTESKPETEADLNNATVENDVEQNNTVAVTEPTVPETTQPTQPTQNIIASNQDTTNSYINPTEHQIKKPTDSTPIQTGSKMLELLNRTPIWAWFILLSGTLLAIAFIIFSYSFRKPKAKRAKNNLRSRWN